MELITTKKEQAGNINGFIKVLTKFLNVRVINGYWEYIWPLRLMLGRKTTSFPGKSLEVSVVNPILSRMEHQACPAEQFLTDGYLGQKNIHLINGNIHKKCSTLNRKLDEMLLLDTIIYESEWKNRKNIGSGVRRRQGLNPGHATEQAPVQVTYVSELSLLTRGVGRVTSMLQALCWELDKITLCTLKNKKYILLCNDCQF